MELHELAVRISSSLRCQTELLGLTAVMFAVILYNISDDPFGGWKRR
jgi:hypothetical protein